MKKVLAIMLVCFMLVSLLPMGALAEEGKSDCPGKGNEHYLSNCDAVEIDSVTVCDGYNYVVYRCTECDDTFADNFVKVEGEHAPLIQKQAAVAATCTKAGKTAVMACPECDYVTGGEVIPALGHQLQEGATCTEPSVCERCEVQLPGQAHTWGDRPTSIVPPTLTVDGSAVYTCTVCPATKTVVVKHHDCVMEDKAGKAPTCEADGYTAYQQCTICQEIVGKETLPATGHGPAEPMLEGDELTVASMKNYQLPAGLSGTFTFSYTGTGNVRVQCYDASADSWTELAKLTNGQSVELELVAGEKYRVYSWGVGTVTYGNEVMEIVILGDCYNDGTRVWQCSWCHEKQNDNLGKNHIDFVVLHEIAPTCTTYGYKIVTCIACGYYEKIQQFEPLKHTGRPEDATYVPATCTKDAYWQWTCTREGCGEVQTEADLGTAGCHIVESKHVDPTCKDKGYYFTYCDNNCDDCPIEAKYFIQINGSFVMLNGERVVEIFELGVNSDAHNPADVKKGQIRPEATCTEGKLIAYWCTWCETPVYETSEPLGHNWSETVKEQAPVCNQNGYYYIDCDRCGEIQKVGDEFGIDDEYIYWNYELAASSHNLEGAVRVIFREGNCTVVGLDRYLCQDCGTYILVRDDSTGDHLPAPEDLLGRYDPNNQVEIPEVDPFIANGSVSAENASDGDFIVFVMPCDGTITVTKTSGIYWTDTPADGWYAAGTTWKINPWAFKAFTYEIVITITPDAPEQEFCAQAPTCTEAGWSAAYFCDRCGEYQPCEEYEATGHDTISKADCTNSAVCSICGPYGDPVGHKMMNTVTKPTCDAAGVITSKCTVCGHTEVTEGEAALGHDMIFIDGMLSDEDIRDTDRYAYVHLGCSRCEGTFDYTYEYIEDYRELHIHNYVLVPALCKQPTCSAPGYVVVRCNGCKDEKTLYEYADMDLAQRPHENTQGINLTLCKNNDVTNRTCKHCKKPIPAAAHTWNETYYEANCMTSEYYVWNCECCTAYIVHDGDCGTDGCEKCAKINPEKGPHAWCEWAELPDVGAGRIRYCDICKVADYDKEHVFVSATVESANGASVITDGSTVIVTIYLSGAERDVWGVKLDMAYTNLVPVLNEDGSVKANWVNDSFTGTKAVNDNDGYISIMADAQTFVELNDKQALVELYFTAKSREASDVGVTFEALNEEGINELNNEALDAEGNYLPVMTYDDTADTVVLLDVDGDGYVTIKDAYLAYQLNLAGETNAAVDLNGDGEISGKELKDMYDFIVGAKTYEDILALLA